MNYQPKAGFDELSGPADLPRLYTSDEAADFLRLTKGALAKQRASGTGVPYIIVGRRTVRYLWSDLLKFLVADQIG